MESETPVQTVTERDQWMVENEVFQIYNFFANAPRDVKSQMLKLRRDRHLEYLDRGLRFLGPSFCVLDANRPWLCYWIIHSIALLGESLDTEMESNTIDFLRRCQDQDGGYGGGPGQMPHLATTYATVNSLITVGGHEALSSINRDKLYTFLQRMKHPSGGFRMHDGGEIDVRACYTAISVASILNILDDELVQDVGNYILSCQTFEGGIAGEPGSEAHGGYTFCGLATMILINEVERLDLTRLIDWLVFRQGREGGFQGRTNKLVDGCYSFWQGGDFALFRKLGELIDEQLVTSDARGHCSIDSPHTAAVSGTFEGEESLEETSSQVDKTRHRQEEILALEKRPQSIEMKKGPS
ncbi:protein farnesyltransferase subunit beta [Morus notabilis]|uniref:protein farnesyltransferase subunit beta n=1 Tax=Morus notabilis TaxID=981085 RepID=UPI000CED27EB|nr:protein farnesyltransferase subunit beta [Morus notabilis]